MEVAMGTLSFLRGRKPTGTSPHHDIPVTIRTNRAQLQAYRTQFTDAIVTIELELDLLEQQLKRKGSTTEDELEQHNHRIVLLIHRLDSSCAGVQECWERMFTFLKIWKRGCSHAKRPSASA